jgi:hypothetical protein
LSPGLPLTQDGKTAQPARIFVDNSLMFALSQKQELLDCKHIDMTLAAMIEAIFVIMGDPDIAICQCPLAMDKWLELVIKPVQTMISLVVDTNRLMVAIPQQYINKVRDLLATAWHVNRRSTRPKNLRESLGTWQRELLGCITC